MTKVHTTQKFSRATGFVGQGSLTSDVGLQEFGVLKGQSDGPERTEGSVGVSSLLSEVENVL